jgi:hypothetical protein
MVANALARAPRWDFDVPNVNNLLQPIQRGYEQGMQDRQQAVDNKRADEQLGMQRERLGFERSRMARQDESERLTRLGKMAAALHTMPDTPEKAARAKALMDGHADLAPQFARYGINGADPVAAVGMLAQSWGELNPLDIEAKRAQIAQARATTANQSSQNARAQAEHNARMAQFETMTPQQRAQAAPTVGLEPGTPTFNAFVATGKYPAAENTNTAQQPTWGQDDQGRPVIMQLDRSGRAVRTALPPGVTPIPPGDLAFDKAQGQERGEAFGKNVANLGKAEGAFKAYETQQNIVTQDIDRVLKGTNWATTGWVGNVGTYIPGSPAYNLARTLDTIKANIGFDKLAEMRANSPTGGALGAVTEFENKLLQSVLGSLEQAQSPEQLRYNLQRLKDTISTMRTQRREALESDQRRFGGMANTPPPVLQGPRANAPPQAAAPTAPSPAQSARPRAVNPQTGQAVEWNGSAWVPAQ